MNIEQSVISYKPQSLISTKRNKLKELKISKYGKEDDVKKILALET